MQNCCFENASKLIHSYINFLISITADWRGKTNLSSASLYCANQDIFLLISGALNWKVTRFEVLFFSGRAILAWTWNYGRKKKNNQRKGHFQKTPWTHWLVKKCDGLILTGSISFCQWDNVFLSVILIEHRGTPLKHWSLLNLLIWGEKTADNRRGEAVAVQTVFTEINLQLWND